MGRIDGTEEGPNSHQKSAEEIKAENRKKMEEQRAVFDQKDSTDQGLLLSIDGAKIKFNAHMGEFKVLTDVPTTQGKLTGTIVEKQVANFTFYDGFKILTTTQWSNFGSAKVQENFVLLKKSILPATGKMPGNAPIETGKIEFVTSGQINIPESLDTNGAPIPTQEQINTNPCSADFTLTQIKSIWPNAKNTEWLKDITNELNKEYVVNKDGGTKKLYEIFGLDTCLQRAHFFAQAYVESSEDLSGAFYGENLNYSVSALRSGYPFSVFKNNKKYFDYADEIGRKSEIDSKTKKNKLIHPANQEEIANVAYDDANRGEKFKLGNIQKGDGWKFRGRGLMQITGRSNYKSIQEIIDKKLPNSNIDLSLGKSTFTAKEAVFAGLGDWILKKADKIAPDGTTPDIVNSITSKINKSTQSYDDRRKAFLRTKEIFK